MPRILSVEDEVTNQEVVAVICRSANHACICASNGQEALTLLEREPPIDLILSDVLMPVMDGLQFVEIVRADPRWRHIPIIALTAKASSADRQACLSAGMDRVMTKPFRSKELLALIEQTLTAIR